MKHTDFLKLNRPLDDETYTLLYGLARTRRMKRDNVMLNQISANSDFGIEGEFYFNPMDFENDGQSMDSSIIDYNDPPSFQPTLWLHWFPSTDRKEIIWNGGDFTEGATEWMAYIIFKILAPKGYKLNGTVDVSDSLKLRIENNQMHVNNRFIDLMTILMNIENARTQMRLRLGLIPYRILKMEMAPNGRLAVEIEATRSELIIVLSNVENRFSLESFSRIPLSQYSGSLKVSSDQIRILWSNDSLRAAIYLGNDMVSVIDFKSKQFLKSNPNIAELNSLTKYFDAGIEKGMGQSFKCNSQPL